MNGNAKGASTRSAFRDAFDEARNGTLTMMRIDSLAVVAVATTALFLAGCGDGGPGVLAVGEAPAALAPSAVVSQASIDSGAVGAAELIERGRALFVANFNTLDGAGRPETDGVGNPRGRREAPENFNRVSAPDANSCAGCHNMPFSGGGGDNVANVFVMGQRFPFVEFQDPPQAGDNFEAHTLKDVANERNTLGMFGSGYVELLAREMSVELQGIRAAASAQAATNAAPVAAALTTKGVSFGSITANPDGTFDVSAVEGVDADLVVKPFHQKGVVSSIRVFTNNAMNHHHGVQTTERFGAGVDADADGKVDEMGPGDVTATTLYQATLQVPGRVLPTDSAGLAVVANGEALFSSMGCATCHTPFLKLDSPMFSEPGPFNPAGNLRPADVPAPFVVDLTTSPAQPQLSKEPDGSVFVPLFSDLKRHDMGPNLNNEALVQNGVPTTQWLTKKLWGFASEPPFLHHGRATLISEAILAHGGEGQAARDAFANASPTDQSDLVAFLKTLQVLPQGTTTTTLSVGTGATGDEPVVATHMDQAALEAGTIPLATILDHGKLLFGANFNTLDGQGRPATTGTGGPRAPRFFPENFNRVSAPDANSCAGCHNLPRFGGGGDQVANVFVMGQRFPFVNFDSPPGEGDGFEAHTLQNVANERNTLGMFGSGFIELLAREMSVDLIAIKDAAIAEAGVAGTPVTKALVTKGVGFGVVVGLPGGGVDLAGVVGVDQDLVVKPFHQKGAVVSLREFSNNAMNHHHGMQSSERFGAGVDADLDGLADELTQGDISAVSIFQALLAPPGRVLPAAPARKAAAALGEARFSSIGCATCHVPALKLNDPVFTEPGPFNPPGNLGPAGVSAVYAVDLVASAVGPTLTKLPDGSVMVPAFTDLKRHDMGPLLNNEALQQNGIPTSQWLTKKLWGFANEPPYLHHGRALTIEEAILAHGGEGQAARDAYAALNRAQKDQIIEFLRTLQVLPESATTLSIEE